MSAAGVRSAAAVFKALGNPSRVIIVDALARGEHCVAALTELVQLDISTVSNHLSVLRQVGIVVDERRGTQVFYRLRKPCLLSVFCCLDEFHAAEPVPARAGTVRHARPRSRSQPKNS